MSAYSPKEERYNIISHAIGCFLSVIGLILLLLQSIPGGDLTAILSVSIFGVSLITLYAASTLYHSATEPSLRYKLNIFDHSAIYVLIAGTYTPFTLISLNGTTGWTIFGISWGMALIGIVLKLFFTGKYNRISTLMYILMGWMIVFAFQPLVDNLASAGLYWLIAGGVAYTVGAIFFSIERIKFNHAIFHLFVLLGSFCHFYSVYFYVLPSSYTN